jgi:hypothetical protein
MDLARRIGIGIVMIVPTFVGAGAIWDMIHSSIAVIIWIIIMAGVSGAVISGKYLKSWEEREFKFG